MIQSMHRVDVYHQSAGHKSRVRIWAQSRRGGLAYENSVNASAGRIDLISQSTRSDLTFRIITFKGSVIGMFSGQQEEKQQLHETR